MTSRSLQGNGSSLRGRGVHQTSSYMIELKVCELRRRDKYTHVEVDKFDMLSTLKEKIARELGIDSSTSKFTLEVYDVGSNRWKKTDNRYPSDFIQDLKLQAGDLISVEYKLGEITRNNSLPSHTSIRNDNGELTLQLCTKPRELNNSYLLNISANSTLGTLRKEAYSKLNKLANDRPIYRLDNDEWTQFGSDMDHRLLTDLKFRSRTFICLDYDENTSTSKSPTGICGLANLGSTCYMNSVFQCLSNIPEFTKQILALGDEIDAPILGGYVKLMKRLWSDDSLSIDPDLLVTSIGECSPTYTTYRQQDAQEFMNHFLDLIHGELSAKETLVTQLFYGHIRSTVRCLTCQAVELTNESISFLPLPISDYNIRTILYLKADGEQCSVSITIDSYVYYIKDLVDNFIKQYDSKLTRDRIEPVQLNGYRIITTLDIWTRMTDIADNEMAFLEKPEMPFNHTHIWCDFINSSTEKSFRPSILLGGPSYNCRYSHLADQIDQILGHLCSITRAQISDCHIYWHDRDKNEYKLNITDNMDKDLPYVRRIIIALDSFWVEIYKAQFDSNYSSNSSGLFRLLDDFFDESPLDGYHCLKCPKPTKARQKSNLILPLPRVLIIQLKRFVYNENAREKIDTLVSFPLEGLDLKKYLLNDNSQNSTTSHSTTYDLVAVSNHSGSMSFGHYTTYAKNRQDKNWYSFDDRLVRKLSDVNDVITKNAYILVYVQNNP